MNDDKASQNLANTLGQLRDLRGWTQSQLAEHSGVPRPTIATLESGSANPTMGVLVRIARALGVTIDELVSPPIADVRMFRSADLAEQIRGTVRVRELVPDALPGITVERLAFPPGSRMSGVPHKPGTREYLTCERGQVRLTAAGETFELGPGDVVVFRGDQRHGYLNPGADEAVAYSVVVPVR
ncbi:MAG: helix-turn-helix domain-containing protein [Alphaproteobacteria bacterium]|nr:helix-turn-helix domain-containing protein [Alphaproteobacteria bacterium]